MSSSEGGRPSDAARTMDVLRRIVHALHAANGATIGELGVSGAQLFILRRIAADPGLSVKTLAQRTRAAPSSVSEVVSRLLAAGLVERRQAADDARRADLRLTAAGAWISERAEETVQERLVRSFDALAPGDQRLLADVLERWISDVGIGGAQPSLFFESDRQSEAPKRD